MTILPAKRAVNNNSNDETKDGSNSNVSKVRLWFALLKQFLFEL